MIFCKVNQGLIDLIMEQAAGRHIVDVGCGEGLLGNMLQGVISIDINPDFDNALVKDIIQVNAIDFPFNEKCFPVFLRPCHGIFVDMVLEAHKYHVKNFLYVSMPHNFEDDVDLVQFNGERVGDWVGEDGEYAYLITLKKEEE